ncbi:MAG: phosphoesterase [Deltaproteobacteria bacterium]|jgi:phosphoesterase RecJ-like protein|nr:phosphoesterase [Deltaproteobacteria bacterium]MBP2683558.1 phosphoesterase [Deltaproteobacteria bacterium]MBP2688282.1 phosphoesterase [Deltaproteobacteria bacterium]MBS1243825.1 phosphoesterase [Deltaproteobacteria bacterium]
MRGDLSAICRILREKDRFLVACHENPEGDAIGSELALALALRKMGKTATVLNADPVPGNLLFLPGADTVVFEEDGSRYDVAVVLDCGSPERTGRVAPELRKCPLLVNIDHHRTNGDRGELSLVDPDAAATGLLIHRVLSAMGYDICLDVATNIYVAVLTDTGSFHYSSSSPEAFEVAGEMVRRGVDPWAVAERVYETQSAHRLRLLGRVLDSLEVSAGGKVASITTMRETLREFAAGKDALEGFINYPRSIVGVEVAVSFREEEGDVFRVSFRSKGRVDVSAVAARFGGGGHRNAAGCTVPGALPDVKRKVLEALAAVLS